MKKYIKTLFNITAIRSGVLILVIINIFLHFLSPGGELAITLREARHWFENNVMFFVLLAVILLLFSSVRGTLRSLFIPNNSSHPAYISAYTSVILIILFLFSGKYFIPNHPYYYMYFAVIFSIPAFIFIFTKLIVKRYKHVNGGLATDEPLTSRETLADTQMLALENLKKIIQFQQQIRSVGLYGEWGSGKTSIFNIAKNEIKQNDKKIIWVEIEPWRYTSQEALVLGFYEQIGVAIERDIPGMQNSASELLSIAEPLVRTTEQTGIGASVIGWVQSRLKRLTDDPSMYIKKILEREGRYMVVAVDNVERNTDPAQIMRTLQLVHFLKDKSIVYVFITEKDKLLNAIGQVGNSSSVEYLEKFVEHELELLKPSSNDLEAFFYSKLSSDDLHGHSVELSDTITKDFGTYRGVIKVYNQFQFELNTRFYRNDRYIINLTDKFEMDYIHTKYPLVWNHIEQNRNYYDNGNRSQNDLLFWSEDEQTREARRAKSINEAIEINVPADEVNDFRELLASLFPQSYHIIVGRSKQQNNYEVWRRERRVAVPDVLDEYFARSQTQETYDRDLKDIDNLHDEMQGHFADDDYMFTVARRYLVRLMKKPEVSNAARLTVTEILFREQTASKAKSFLRSMLRAYMDSANLQTIDKDRIMFAILAGINQFVSASYSDESESSKRLNYIFKSIEDYTEHPSAILRLALYINPGRNNDLFAIQRWGENNSGYDKFREKALRFVDDYYLEPVLGHNLFDNKVPSEWRFIFYQWALSIRSFNIPNRLPLHFQTRKKRVNNYVFERWSKDHKLAYKCLRADMYVESNGIRKRKMWSVNRERLDPYDISDLMTQISAMVYSDQLSSSEKKNMRLLHAAIERYIDGMQVD